MFDLKNKIIFITGASSGIGAGCAIRFAKVGAKLILCARRKDLVDEMAEELRKTYSIDIYTLQLDVRSHQDVEQKLASLPENWRSVAVLINNAGLAAGLDSVQEGQIEDWDAMIDTNVKGLLYVTRAILPTMVKRNTGHIINIGSIAGHEVYPRAAVYCATKYAVNALSAGLRMDLFGTKIRVSTIDPGAVETNFSIVRFKGDEERAKSVYKGIEPLTPEDIADAAYYCASCPPHVNISEMIIMPTVQASATMMFREERK